MIFRFGGTILALAAGPALTGWALAPGTELTALRSPIVLAGSATTAFRDPAAIFVEGKIHLFYTYVQSAGEQTKVRMAVAESTSGDLQHWTSPRILTPLDPRLNYSSPGSVVRFRGAWWMCVSSYPRPNGEVYGNKDARAWLMRSVDLVRWSAPELLRLKGPAITQAAMGRIIDPCIYPDKDDPARWWCLFKQNGKVHRSWSTDLKNWTHAGTVGEGENACVVVKDGAYYLFSSPANGIAVARSPDGLRWQPLGLFTLGQAGWPWARGRLTAPFVLDLRDQPAVGKYVMFFHGTGPDPEPTVFDTQATLGIAWSDDLLHWAWPGVAP